MILRGKGWRPEAAASRIGQTKLVRAKASELRALRCQELHGMERGGANSWYSTRNICGHPYMYIWATVYIYLAISDKA